MSDTQEIDGVTITTIGGGFYDLTHVSLAEPERVRGKENADARAKEIAAAAAPAEGSMEPQPSVEEALAALVSDTGPDPRDAQMAQMQEMMARQQAMIEQLLARPAATVMAEGAEAAPPDPRRILPTEFSGKVADVTRDAAKKIGVEYVTIHLEEGPDIPPTGLFISHNGRGYMISPGEPVDVPDFLLGVLDDAVMSTAVVDSKSQKVVGWRSRSKYPYRRL
jgi:hypothetical protein